MCTILKDTTFQISTLPHTASQSSNINLISWAVILNLSLYCTVQYSAPILVLYLLSLLSRSFLCLLGGRVIHKILCRNILYITFVNKKITCKMYIETENNYIPFNQENRRAELLSNIRQYGTYIVSTNEMSYIDLWFDNHYSSLKWTRQVFINPQLIFEKSSLKTNKLIQRLWLSGRSSVLTSQDSRSLLWKCDE